MIIGIKVLRNSKKWVLIMLICFKDFTLPLKETLYKKYCK